MREAACQTLYTYWNEVRRDRMAPMRFDIEPSRISGILPDTFILERSDSATVRFRLAGTRLCETFDTEFRGQNLFSLFDSDDQFVLQQQFAVMVRQGAVARFSMSATTGSGRSADFDMILLPLVHSQNAVDRFIGAIGPVGDYAWLGTEPVGAPKIVTHDLIWPDGRPHAVIEQGHFQAPFRADLPQSRLVRANRRQFRVYDGGLEKGKH